MAKRRFEKDELVSTYEKRANTPDVGPVEEIEMSAHNEVFGERHDHNRGVGRKLKGKSSSRRTQLSHTQDMPMDPRVERQLEKLTRTMLWMSQRLGPNVRLPTEEELFGMPMPLTQTFQPQMSGDGFASSSQPGNFQYHQAQQCPIPFMYPLSSPQQMSPFPWLSSPMSQLQVNYMQHTPQMHQTQHMQQQPLQMYQQPFMHQMPSMQQTPQMQHTPQIQQQPSMQHTPQMPQQPPMQHTPQMQQQTPQMHQMHLMQQMPHLQQMPSMQQTPHMQQMPSIPSMHHMPPTS
ncbi:altered inheritance of mitochondria protein 3-like [Cannabis sativa]|uniref:altered inheritance of mitochondria protein 3-like n=1 Tax=Cannabis sativa TaxID=3483 RepID=UPI0029CA30DB|nr:altered inheritance of mitochondria protein 3-like [Cannabis sativa]